MPWSNLCPVIQGSPRSPVTLPTAASNILYPSLPTPLNRLPTGPAPWVCCVFASPISPGSALALG